MKKALQLTFGIMTLAGMLSLNSCDKLKNVVKTPDVTFTGASTDIVIPPTNDTTAQGDIASASFSYNIDSMIQAQTGGVVTYKSIKSVKISSVTLTLTDADAANNFANFEYAGLSFNTDANGGRYDPYTLAYIEHNPDTYSASISPTVTDAKQDIKKYFNNKTTFAYIYTAKLRRPIKKTLHCHAEVAYTIGF